MRDDIARAISEGAQMRIAQGQDVREPDQTTMLIEQYRQSLPSMVRGAVARGERSTEIPIPGRGDYTRPVDPARFEAGICRIASEAGLSVRTADRTHEGKGTGFGGGPTPGTGYKVLVISW